jgi:nucleoside-diphosphate-sugar epimerase
MTRFSVGYIAKSMIMSIDQAKQNLNYSPSITNRGGFEKYTWWYYAQGSE